MFEEPLPFTQVKPADIAYIINLLATQHPICKELQDEFHQHAIAIQLAEEQHLLHQGHLCHYMYFIREGALMAYSLHKQKKITTYISVENEFVSSLSGLYGEKPSREAIVAIEPTLVLGVHTDILQNWYQRFFDLNFIIRKVYENYYRDAQERSHIVRVGNAKERYAYFVKSKPGYVDRLPLECVASFLDMKPETLARIKKQDYIKPQDDLEAERLLAKMKDYIHRTECFKEKNLKVQDLAMKLDVPGYKLSHVLNSHVRKNFKDFINHYRISYLKAQLEKVENLQSFTMEALALQAGFASRSGFYKAFSKAEGVSPRVYLAGKAGKQ
ncbi:helix-turn-helix domain-containing protein [Pontibacter sp. JH31]|uniref:Helix-turn-helix domain-containing protein n=1 Tax=Pontibacter aquaedesilientis TaxID=2766980 RepID=A0ABR7XKT6_9BACT|nr:helix-turn-helix domain-containing protein [Pontibacter aquaedesilientis]MBD1398873.1 helix-turn-helix domain-containing protein [Pontibacter aquaedesilientis]